MWLWLVGLAWSQTTVGQLSPGDLVITEVMKDPDAVSDDDGEWFELYNNAGTAVDLLGLVVGDYGVDSTPVSSSVIVPAGSYAVIGTNLDTFANGGVGLDHAMSLTLANGADELVLSYGAVILDEILWDDGAVWPDTPGASLSLDPASLGAGQNDNGANWCDGLGAFGAGDLGSPGAPNPSCSGGVGVGTGGGVGTGTGAGPGTGGGATGTGTGGLTDTGGTGGLTGTGTGATGTAATGTGTGFAQPEYAKLGCGCDHRGGPPASPALLALALLGRRRYRLQSA